MHAISLHLMVNLKAIKKFGIFMEFDQKRFLSFRFCSIQGFERNLWGFPKKKSLSSLKGNYAFLSQMRAAAERERNGYTVRKRKKCVCWE